MNQDNGVDYYRRREATSRALAARAADQAVCNIHAELAERYAERVRQLTPKMTLSLAFDSGKH